MRRRRVIALLATGLSSIAGCSSLWQRSGGAPEETPSPTGAAPTDASTTGAAGGRGQRLADGYVRWATVGEQVYAPGTWSVQVAEVSVRATVGVVASPGPDSVIRRVLAEPGKQFVVSTVVVGRASDTGAPTPRADTLVTGLLVDGDRVGGAAHSVDGPFAGRNSVRLAHPVRVGEAESAAVAVRSPSRGGRAWPGANWRLPDDSVAALAARPRFEVESVEAPVQIARGATIEATVSVANTGSRDGTFRAWFVIDDRATLVTVPLSTGETATRTISARSDPAAETVSLRLSWGKDSVTRTVGIEG